MNINLFWGKTRSTQEQEGGRLYKPVLHHMIDVAAVAMEWQRLNKARLRREALLWQTSEEALIRMNAFLAGLHDIGKFARAFQVKRADLWPTAILGPYAASMGDLVHWRASAYILGSSGVLPKLKSLFPSLEDDDTCAVSELIASVAGHHGQPPESNEYACHRADAGDDKARIGLEALKAAQEAFERLHDLVQPEPIESLREIEQAQAWSWGLNGLITLCDWVGSDAQIFTFEDPDMPLADYYASALDKARTALLAKGLAPATPRKGVKLRTLAPALATPRTMQHTAETIALAQGPQLVIIEDSTGSGKTEAALVLAARMMESGKGEGLYFALPTMATANAMYERLEHPHHALFEESGELSLVLAHGKASLSERFMRSRTSFTKEPEGLESTAGFCNAWIADGRRKALFAHVGAGTIDQAFLAVLKKKYLTLRQYALAGRILIIDEAHAFDAYMGEELERLLEVHAALGGSAIVLSATLPLSKRQAMVTGFLKGLDPKTRRQPPPAALASDAYPALTCASRSEVSVHAVPFCDDLRRKVDIRRLDSVDEALGAALEVARAGAAVLIIRNAVDEAIKTYEALSDHHAQISLFHARFAMVDRLRHESDALTRFGRNALPQARAGAILVSTQVVEQSLDLDFDLIISDLAPIDLLIQRAGRLWRHMDRRPAAQRALDAPRMLVISPDPTQISHADWLKGALGGGAFVYNKPGILWRSAKVLFDAGQIVTPDDLRSLIARVYESDDAPEVLSLAQNKAEGSEFGQKSLASGNVIRFESGYGALGKLSSDQEIGTRYGEPTITLRLAREVEGKLVPWASAPPDNSATDVSPIDLQTQRWALSEVTVREKWLGPPSPSTDLVPLMKTLRASWPDWDTTKIAIVDPEGYVTVEGRNPEKKLWYNDKLGLRYA